ncbi:Chemotaxis response regulator [Parvularcula bermudensis HTCC2503]|uniref:Chemotaxis response regulator n=1 Tax=Parvularcula bermudensis (strain ATCC BAA-594 / HTCC2503 / KCTC 12087) TaxID=314260 RepID=E0TFX7_PARBH|nr:response regulator [Parvularcula bermudensis]ADM09576.1 Chemotaxis response regulator [Parvularcula bermudensis HTCC2503]
MSLRETIRIMIVDDMSTSRGILKNSLYEIGIKNVDFATDGEEALKSLVGRPAHLVLCDYNMPGMDGLGLLKALRDHKPTSRVGFILVTGTDSKEVIQKGVQLGMNNYLKKPYTTDSLRECITKVVGKL